MYQKEIEAYFADKQEQILADIARLVRIKSEREPMQEGMPFGKGPYEALMEGKKLAEERGLSTKNFDNYVITAEAGPQPAYLGILAHLDVVSEGSGWTMPPYEMTVRDGRIYGRGTADDKGPAVVALWALKAAKELCPQLKKGVRLILGSAEETGSEDLDHYLPLEAAPPVSFSPDAEYPVINIEKGGYKPIFGAKWDEDPALPRVCAIHGGTTTNIGVIKNGRPGVEYASVGGHDTYVNSLDVKVQGVAGGSMVRAGNKQILDVGPRSAHIAGLGYAVYTPLEEIEEPELEFFSPKEGDPADYVRIKLKSGKRVTITNSCAANVLGYVKEGDYSRGNVESARKCIQPLADYVGVSVEECCRQILHKAYEHIEPIILNFAEKYKIDRDQIDLVGCGGGASALLPYSAEQLNMRYSLAKHAEVISSIGVALAMIRDVVERVIPNPTTEDIRQIKKEAKEMAIKNGAVPDTIEVQIEIDNQTSKVTAIAMGSNEVQATDLKLRCDIHEARKLAANSMRCEEKDVEDLVSNDVFYIFGHQNGEKHNVRIVDHRGFVKAQCGDAIAEACLAKDWEKVVTEMWEKTLYYKNEMARTPDFFLCIGGKVLDFTSSLNLEQLMMVMRSEFLEADPDEGILLVAARTEIL